MQLQELPTLLWSVVIPHWWRVLARILASMSSMSSVRMTLTRSPSPCSIGCKVPMRVVCLFLWSTPTANGVVCLFSWSTRTENLWRICRIGYVPATWFRRSLAFTGRGKFRQGLRRCPVRAALCSHQARKFLAGPPAMPGRGSSVISPGEEIFRQGLRRTPWRG